MPRKSPRTDNSFHAEVKMLSRFGFDYACEKRIRYDSSRYRLIREPENDHDKNAIAVYISQVKVGYLPAAAAYDVSKEMEVGDIFSVRHFSSDRGTHYNAKYDNDRGDGYYRSLTVQVYNESAISRDTGKALTQELIHECTQIHNDPALTTKYNQEGKSASGCGCGGAGMLGLLVMILSFIMFSLAQSCVS